VAISALIGFVSSGTDNETGEPTCDLFLVGNPATHDTTGQETLRILSPSWMPPIGLVLWGGGGTVEIVDGPDDGHRPIYRRIGSTRLREATDYPKGRFVRGPRPESEARR